MYRKFDISCRWTQAVQVISGHEWLVADGYSDGLSSEGCSLGLTACSSRKGVIVLGRALIFQVLQGSWWFVRAQCLSSLCLLNAGGNWWPNGRLSLNSTGPGSSLGGTLAFDYLNPGSIQAWVRWLLQDGGFAKPQLRRPSNEQWREPQVKRT